jgi:ribosome-binding protein aMBF1 (putative translation factor)
MATHAPRTRRRLDDLAPEERAKVEAARAAARTPEARAEEQAIRAAYADRPSVRELIERGEIDPDSISAGNVYYALLKTAAALKDAREARGLSLTDVSERSGIDRAALSRLENGQNLNPKIETIGRYAGALGLEVCISISEPVH